MVPLRVYFVTSLQGHELAACVSHYPFAFILTCCVDSKIIDTNWKYTWSNISSLKNMNNWILKVFTLKFWNGSKLTDNLLFNCIYLCLIGIYITMYFYPRGKGRYRHIYAALYPVTLPSKLLHYPRLSWYSLNSANGWTWTIGGAPLIR